MARGNGRAILTRMDAAVAAVAAGLIVTSKRPHRERVTAVLAELDRIPPSTSRDAVRSVYLRERDALDRG